MPSKPRPKTFVAVCDFSCAGERYAAGDTVPPGIALRSALRHGNKFVTTERNSPPSMSQPLDAMTVAELEEYAAAAGIELVDGSKKADKVAAILAAAETNTQTTETQETPQ